MTADLLPCPFCGEAPFNGSPTRVKCRTFTCPISSVTMTAHEWNRRAPAATRETGAAATCTCGSEATGRCRCGVVTATPASCGGEGGPHLPRGWWRCTGHGALWRAGQPCGIGALDGAASPAAPREPTYELPLDEAALARQCYMFDEPAAPCGPEALYPCADCGAIRTKAEGGTTFTVCDECWDKHQAAKRGLEALGVSNPASAETPPVCGRCGGSKVVDQPDCYDGEDKPCPACTPGSGR